MNKVIVEGEFFAPGDRSQFHDSLGSEVEEMHFTLLVSYDEALRRASNPDEFKLRVQGIQSTSDVAQEEMEKSMTNFMDDGGVGGSDAPFEFS